MLQTRQSARHLRTIKEMQSKPTTHSAQYRKHVRMVGDAGSGWAACGAERIIDGPRSRFTWLPGNDSDATSPPPARPPRRDSHRRHPDSPSLTLPLGIRSRGCHRSTLCARVVAAWTSPVSHRFRVDLAACRSPSHLVPLPSTDTEPGLLIQSPEGGGVGARHSPGSLHKCARSGRPCCTPAVSLPARLSQADLPAVCRDHHWSPFAYRSRCSWPSTPRVAVRVHGEPSAGTCYRKQAVCPGPTLSDACHLMEGLGSVGVVVDRRLRLGTC